MRPRLNRWIVPLRSAPDAKAKLICLHHSGGGAYGFAPLAAALTRPDVEVLALQLPGRETRFGEAPILDPQDLVVALAEALVAQLDRPYVLFGHSLGALVAHALAVHAQTTGRIPCPSALVVSSARPPASGDELDAIGPVATTSDEQLVARLRQWGGTSAEILARPGFLKLFLPILRADIVLAGALLRQAPLVTLRGRVVAVVGEEDSELGMEGALAWRRVTSGSFSAHALPGGHFYFADRPGPLLAILQQALSQAPLGEA